MWRGEVVVIGGGPAGYTAAIRLRQLGKRATLIEKDELGGVCLNKGCIPSKALLSALNTIIQAKQAAKYGIKFAPAQVDTSELNTWKNKAIQRARDGVHFLLSLHGVELIFGRAEFLRNKTVKVALRSGSDQLVEAENFIVATGSFPESLPGLPFDGESVLSPEEAMDVSSIPSHLIILGGGVVGVELACIYQNLGSRVSIVEKEADILIDFDEDIRGALKSSLHRMGVEILTSTSLEDVAKPQNLLETRLRRENQTLARQAEKLILAIGRKPNTGELGLQQTGIVLDSEGFIKVGEKRQANIPGLYAIGDVIGRPLVAHKAYKEAVAVADVIAGLESRFPRFIPSVVFSAIEAAGVGLTEKEARRQDYKVKVGYFPLTASGRAVASGNAAGFVKVVANEVTEKILGVHIAGGCASELVGEATLALEAGLKVREFADIVRPHPTLSEAFTEASLDVYSQSIHFIKSAKVP